MRLDLFLKTSRIIIRRSLAQEFCDAGLISVNSASAKASKDIKAGDRITIKKGRRVTTYLVIDVPNVKQLSKGEAADTYQIESDNVIDDAASA